MKLRGLRKRWLLTVAAITVPVVAIGVWVFTLSLSGLELSEAAIQHIAMGAAGMGALLIAVVLLANLHFLRSITAPILELTDGIVDIVETGATLKANGLVPIETVAEVSARLIVNTASMKLHKTQILAFIEACERELERRA